MPTDLGVIKFFSSGRNGGDREPWRIQCWIEEDGDMRREKIV